MYAMEYYSVIKKSEITPLAATWMDPETVALSEMSQTEGEIAYDISYSSSLKRNNTNELIKQKETHKVRKQTHGCQGEGMVRTLARSCTHCYT